MSAKSMENDSVPAGELFPDYRRSVALKYVKRGFHILISHSLTILCVPLAAFGVLELMNMYHQGELQKLWLVGRQTELTFDLITVVLSLTAMLVALVSYAVLKQKPVYMLDFAVCKPPDSWMVSYDQFMSGSCLLLSQRFTEDSLVFQERIIQRSGLGQKTYLPPALHRLPTHPTMAAAREEFEDVMFTTIHDLLQKTGVKPKEIAILVINCSLFNPTPSLSAMVINHFKMRSNIISYNLSGMGCGSSPISIDLARQMLQLYPHSYALVLSTENITQNWYPGNDRSMLMPNCLFRVGGAAMLLSNRRRDAWRAKYELLHTVRTHLGGNDLAYKCIFQMEDDDGIMGVRLSKELMAVAGEALKVNVTTLGPLVLPISEQLVFMVNLVLRKVLHRKIKPYIPDFKLAFDKVCIHTGGRAVVDEIEKQLHLTPSMVEPSRATLYRYGNTSSSSVWYVLAYIETHMGLQRGERVWQMGFGSGFKCNSAVWRARRRIKVMHQAWSDFDVDEMRAHLASLPNHHTKPVPKAA
ncbi:FAE1/Type III polyketide synthase-like protein-domain-containing protein [Haematococcus lacustris]